MKLHQPTHPLPAALLSAALLASAPLNAAVLFSQDYNLTGFGPVTEVLFSTDFTVPSVDAISTIEIEMAHSYVAELTFILTAPTGESFQLMHNNGFRVSVGTDNTGLLESVALYTLVHPTEAALSVTDWHPIELARHVLPGTYGAIEWPEGDWENGTWNLTLSTTNRASSSTGSIGNITITGIIPELTTSSLLLLLASLPLLHRKRT